VTSALVSNTSRLPRDVCLGEHHLHSYSKLSHMIPFYSYTKHSFQHSLRKQVCNKKLLQLIMLSILLFTPLIAALSVSPCLIATIRVSLKFGALRGRLYRERIWLQVLMTFRGENEDVREFRRAKRLIQSCWNVVQLCHNPCDHDL
jgi:hypothetical protein